MDISIIIPIYNVQNYIIDCLKSVIMQTYTGKIECLLIDDCGTDNSIKISNNFISQYKGNISFHIIPHKRNRGLSASRNTGINAAKGKYIFFLDSDDWLYPTCIESLAKAIETEKDIDYAIGNYNYDSNTIFPPLRLETGVYKNNILELYTQEMFYMMAWNKLYKTDFIKKHSLTFKEGLLHEDELWSFCCACHTHKIAVINKETLYYRVREGSIQNNLKFCNHHKHYCNSCLYMINYAFDKGLENNRIIFNYINKRIKWLFISPYFENQRELSKCFYFQLRNSRYWSFKQIGNFTQNNLKRLILHFHRYIPKKIGYLFFTYLFLRFYDK